MASVAITSVLGQTWHDFELIISDNSDDPMSNSGASWWIAATKDPRVRYVHWADEMVLSEHFDKASRLPKGHYTIILTDRFLMRPSALMTLHKIVATQEVSPPILVWPMKSALTIDGAEQTQTFDGGVERLNTQALLSEFLEFSQWRSGDFYYNKLPRGLNCAFRRDLFHEIVQSEGQLFGPYSPDYVSAFTFCAFSSEILFLDLPIFLEHGNKSTGANSFLYGVFKSSVDPFEDCPLKVDSVFNSVVRDFIAVRKRVGRRIAKSAFSLSGYYLSIYSELVDKELSGSPLDVKAMFATWEEAVCRLDPVVSQAVRVGQAEMDRRRRPRFYYWRTRLILQLGLRPWVNSWRRRVTRAETSKERTVKYSDALEAAAATDHYLSIG